MGWGGGGVGIYMLGGDTGRMIYPAHKETHRHTTDRGSGLNECEGFERMV